MSVIHEPSADSVGAGGSEDESGKSGRGADEAACVSAFKKYVASDFDDDPPRFSDEELATIEVTPDMVEAGIDEFGWFGSDDPDEWTVTMVYKAMELQRRRSLKAIQAASPATMHFS